MKTNYVELAHAIVHKDSAIHDANGAFRSTDLGAQQELFFSHLFHQHLLAMHMTPERLGELFLIYVEQPGASQKQERDARLRLAKALTQTQITYAVYLKGLKLLRATNVVFSACVEFRNDPSLPDARRVVPITSIAG
jgi:hypothetical protein